VCSVHFRADRPAARTTTDARVTYLPVNGNYFLDHDLDGLLY
jgi:hypothetical protein